jgi:hypothetical protein
LPNSDIQFAIFASLLFGWLCSGPAAFNLPSWIGIMQSIWRLPVTAYPTERKFSGTT